MPPNPQAYWRFDESSGNPVDATGGGATLTNNNTVGFATGALNNAADFGASNTNKTFTNSNQYGIAVDGAKSFAGWVNITTAPLSGEVYDIMGMGYSANDVAYIFEYGNFAGTVRFRVGRARMGIDDPTILHTVTLTTGTWHHIAYTCDASQNQVFYLNATNVGSNTATAGNGSFGGGTFNGTMFSRAPFAAARFHQGLTDEWGVWNSVLTSAEITTLYNAGAPLAYPFTAASTPSRLMTMGIG